MVFAGPRNPMTEPNFASSRSFMPSESHPDESVEVGIVEVTPSYNNNNNNITSSSQVQDESSTGRYSETSGAYVHQVGGDYDDEYDDSTSRHYNDDDEADSNNIQETLPLRKKADGATKVVWCTKILAIVVLVLSAASAGALTYSLISSDEQEDFKLAFDNSAQEIARVALQNADNIFNSIQVFAALYTAHVRAHQPNNRTENPFFVNLPDFERFAAGTRNVAGASLLAYSPLLTSPDQRFDWEDWAAAHQEWIPPGSNAVLPYVWRPHILTGAAELDPGPPPFLPLWQMSPLNTSALQLDLMSTALAEIAGYTLQSAEPTLSRPAQTLVFGDTDDTPRSVFVEPVLDGFHEQAKIRGVISAVIPWDSYFGNLLPKDSQPVVVVAESCGVNSTFVLDGPQAIFLGEGDLHDDRYSHMEVYAPFVLARNSGSSSHQCFHSLHIFPSQQFQSYYETNAPVVYTIVVVCIFVFAIVVFFIYDLVVTIRQSKTESEANRTDAIIAQMFPAKIREQLFMSEALSKDTKNGTKSSRNAVKRPRKNTKRRFSTGRSEDEKSAQSDSLDQFMNQAAEQEAKSRQATRAIAELYPEATILFADVPGFTAWSSIREPAHVFMLLEAIFQAFDKSAHRRRVFKIETVGDCYVAAVGVPEHCPDHARVMARYARDIMRRFHKVVQALELTLGPDTSDLGLRIGIHSGPITGGVLRGDRARFQLFGDTMNTTARVQTSGLRDCIHVSEQTASLLVEQGKKKWLVPRQDQVEAKGKGILKTFWLKTKSSDHTSGGDHSASELEGSSSFMTSETESSAELDLIESQEILKSMEAHLAEKAKTATPPKAKDINERLVAWNCELLINLLKKVVGRQRGQNQSEAQSPAELLELAQNIAGDKMVVEEVAELISLPAFNESTTALAESKVELSDAVVSQIQAYVTTIARMYQDNPFHNFEHASHVTMSVSKLLSRIVAPQASQTDKNLHDHTYGITSDPLTQFAVVLSALIHDVDHRGVPNFLLVKEDAELAGLYQNKSVAEQNSVDMAWDALMIGDFEDLRRCIFKDETELRRFRQLLVNSVIATDIFDKELGLQRRNRWKKAFEAKETAETREDVNRKATIVIEHLIQASDVSHTMQHWQVYQKWNRKLFQEMYEAFLCGRSDKDPSQNWYNGEIGFFDNYIIPLAKKLKECGVFGVSSDEYLNYAQNNRREWEDKGKQIVADMVSNCNETFQLRGLDE